MNTYEAAKILGCTPPHVRRLIAKGTLKAKKIMIGADFRGKPKYFHDISPAEVQRVKGLPIKARGVPRGSQKKI